MKSALFITFFIVTVFTSYKTNADSFPHTISIGDKFNKLGARDSLCSDNTNSALTSVKESIDSDGTFYATAYKDHIRFNFGYPSNSNNSGVRSKIYVYKKGSSSYEDKGSVFDYNEYSSTLSNSGATGRYYASSKLYDGDYFLVIKLVPENSTSPYCLVQSEYLHIDTNKVDGSCGTNAKEWRTGSSEYSGEFCSAGYITEIPSFPSENNNSTWTCNGYYEGMDVNCSASLESQVTKINGSCGGAAQAYDYYEERFSGNFCSAGSLESTPEFPQQGESSSWNCYGENGGTDVNCSASRGDAPASESGSCGTAAKSYTNGSSSYDGSFCSSGELDTEPTFPGAGQTSTWICLGVNSNINDSCQANHLSPENSNSSPVIALVAHGSSYDGNGDLITYEGIDFGTSPSGKYLPIGSEAIIRFSVTDPDNDLDYIEVNFDGSERPPVRVSLDEGDGEYDVSYFYDKANYNPQEAENYWVVPNLEWSAIAYDKAEAPNTSNKLSKNGFGIYDYDEYLDYLNTEKAALEAALQEQADEELRLLAEVEELSRQQSLIDLDGVVNEYIQDISGTYSNILFLEHTLNETDSCLWLNANNECVVTEVPRAGRAFGHIIESENERYNYTVFVNYVFNYQSTLTQTENYPAKVWVEYDSLGESFSTEPLIANNSKHLKFLVGLLVNDIKNTIDTHAGATQALHDTTSILSNSESKLALLQESDFTDRLIERVEQSLSKLSSNWIDGVKDTANEVHESLSLTLDSSQSGLVRGENATRAVYQLGLGTLKTVYSVFEGAVEGAIQPELEIINQYTAEQFNNLPPEQQAVVLDAIDSVNEFINSRSEEERALVEASLFLIASKLDKNSSDIDVRKFIQRSTQVIKKRITVRHSSKPLLEKLHALGYKLRINAKDWYAYGVSFKLVGDLLEDAKKVANGQDKDGLLSENIAKATFEKMLGKKPLNGSYYGSGDIDGKHGFDGVFVEESLDNLTKIHILESKQIKNGAIQLTKETKTNPDQMSDEWIYKVAIELEKLGGEKARLGKAIVDNPELIEKYITVINRSDLSLQVIKL